MKWHSLSRQDSARAVGVGIGVSILTAAIMVTGLKAGISPLPQPLGLAFAETVLGRSLLLPVGLLFHTAWVTTCSVIFVGLFRDALTFLRALGLGACVMDSRSRVLLPRRRLGIFGARRLAEIDRRLSGPAPVVRRLPVGLVAFGVPTIPAPDCVKPRPPHPRQSLRTRKSRGHCRNKQTFVATSAAYRRGTTTLVPRGTRA